MPKFILLIRGEEKWSALSPAEMEATIAKYRVWSSQLREQGTLVHAEPLDRGGRVLDASSGTVTDGPFVETKEMIGGFFLYEAADLDEAVRIGHGCPALGYGGAVEIRPIPTY